MLLGEFSQLTYLFQVYKLTYLFQVYKKVWLICLAQYIKTTLYKELMDKANLPPEWLLAITGVEVVVEEVAVVMAGK